MPIRALARVGPVPGARRLPRGLPGARVRARIRLPSARLGLPLTLVLALVPWVHPSPAQAQATERTLVGEVRSERTDLPIPGASVELRSLAAPIAGRSAARFARTDGDGRFRIGDLPSDLVQLRVDAPGYHTVELAHDLAGASEPLVVRLPRRLFEIEGITATGTPLRGIAPHQPTQALDRESLTRRAAASFGEMLDGEPGLAMRSFGPGTGRPVIRGLDGDRVAVLENGQRMGDLSETAPDHAIAMDPLSADRVEVVRGPASLLYGSSALGGVVNLLREDVPRGWIRGTSGTAALQGATVNRLEAGSARTTHGRDHWAVTARMGLRNGGNFRSPGTPEGVLEGTHTRMRSGGLGLGGRRDAVQGGLSLDWHDHTFGIPEALDDPEVEVELRTHRTRLGGRLEWEGPGTLRRIELQGSAAHYSHQEIEAIRETSGSPHEDVEHDFTRRTAEVTLTAEHGRLGPIADGAVGVSVHGWDLSVRGEEEFHPDGRSVALALFVFERLPLGERVSLQFGSRVGRDRMDARPNPFFPAVGERRHATTISGAAGLSVATSERLRVGAQLARAHRAPLLGELHASGPHLGAARYEIGDPTLRNEIGLGVDAFVVFEGTRVQAELSGFVTRIDDFVFPEPTGEVEGDSGLPIVRWTSTPAEFRGLEGSLEVLPVPTLSLRLVADAVRAGRRDAAGTPLPHIPPARLLVAARYDPGPWWAGIRTRAAGAQERVAREPPSPGYALVDLQAGLRPRPGHLVLVRLDNALDRAYRDHLSRVDDRRLPMPGRNLTVVYRRDF